MASSAHHSITPSLQYSHTPRPEALLRGDLSAPGQDLGLGPGRLGFFDVAVPVVKEGKAGPADLIVWAQRRCRFSSFNCLWKSPQFHQSHAQGMPAIKEIGVDFDASAIFRDRVFKFANGEIPIRVIEDILSAIHERI